MSLKLVQSLKQYQLTPEGQWAFVFAKRPKKGQCAVRHCKRPARVQVLALKGGGWRTVAHRSCLTCQCRLYRANHQDKDAYRQVRDRAHRRGQIFKLTFAEFLAAIEGTEYLARRGRGLDELHLDREKVELGYVFGNVKVITAAENLRKQREVDYAKAEQPF